MLVRMSMNSQILMRQMNRLNGVPFVIVCSIVIVFAESTVASGSDADTTGNSAPSKSAPKTANTPRVLNGSAKDRAQVTSSIQLVVPKPEPHILTSAQSHVLSASAQSRTLNGSASRSPLNSQASATPAPVKPTTVFSLPGAPRPDVYHPILPSRITVIPERTYIKPLTKWNYTMTPKNGIMTWSSGYASTKVTPQPQGTAQTQAVIKPGLQQTSVSASMQQQIGIVPVQRTQINTAVVKPSVDGVVTSKKTPTPPPAVALEATPALLTEMHSEKRSINWDEWYKRVCKVVYDNWEIDQASPGKSCVRVTVWSGREIEARVLSFTPAQGASRDAKRETAFRETSLRAVNSLQKTPVLDFPSRSNRGKIIFDLDMTRSVDGPSGIQVAAFHDIEDAKGSGTYKNSPHAAASSVDSAKTEGVSSAHASGRSSAKYVVTKSAAKSSQTSNSLSTPEPSNGSFENFRSKETSEAPNAFQKAAQSFTSQAYRSSIDFANNVSKHLQFLRWKESSAPAVNSTKPKTQ
jgi:hypothetical protein